jgi:signal peptidase I
MGNAFELTIVALMLVLLIGALITLTRNKSLGIVILRSTVMPVIAILVVMILYKFILGIFIIPSRSMSPTLQEGDHIIVNKFVYRFHLPHFQDVIVFDAPVRARSGDGKVDFVKRVIGIPGDEINFDHGCVVRNGERISEPYVHSPTGGAHLVKVPEGKLYVMGDNRETSSDSRDWGFLDERLVIGRANVVIWPPNRLQYIK